MTIGIVDVGIGNLGSLRQALYNQGWDPVSVSTPEQITKVTHLILPGVGAFASAMDKLDGAGLIAPIQEFAASGHPVLGICLGMQLLASAGAEGGPTAGLGLISGKVVPIDQSEGLRVPHVGWNEAHQLRKHHLLKAIRNDVDFYFVHSYFFSADNTTDVLAVTDYGEKFASIVGRGNVVGVQFHPEKSQSNGIRILDNFCLWDGKC